MQTGEYSVSDDTKKSVYRRRTPCRRMSNGVFLRFCVDERNSPENSRANIGAMFVIFLGKEREKGFLEKKFVCI